MHCRVFDFTAIAERGFVRDVKEKLRYICPDYDTEHKSTAEIVKDKTCELPDRIINIDGAEGFRCVKVLFRPSSTGKEASGFHDTSFHNIMKCDVDIRKVVRQCRVVRWHDRFPKDCGAHDEGTDSVGYIHIGSDHDTDLKSTAEFDKEKTYVRQDEKSITVGAERLRFVEGLSTTLPSRAARSVTLTSARRLTSPRRKHHHRRCHTFPLRGSGVPASFTGRAT